MRLLELFSGTCSIGRVFRENGWTVLSVDLEPRFRPDICCDVLALTPEMIGTRPDLIWASPPCTHYSVARASAKTPRDLEGSDKLVQKVLDLADFYGTPFFMENPMGLHRTRPVVDGIPMHVIDYCKYNDGTHPLKARKRTCIWTNTAWSPARPLCKKDCGFCEGNRHIDHVQLRSKNERFGHTLEHFYAIPKALPQELCEASARILDEWRG